MITNTNATNSQNTAKMTFHVLTLFPEMIQQACEHSILKRAMTAEIIRISCINIRDFAVNKHGQVDDEPYGGGAGMVMMSTPIYQAYTSVIENLRCSQGSQSPQNSHFVYLSPQGKPFTQQKAADLSAKSNLILLCGHYEGVDQRVLDLLAPEEISIGDYVLTGGELPALVLIDAVARLVPGVVGKNESTANETFSNNLHGMLEYPQYTRPQEFQGLQVPPILLSGHHKNIENWRKQQSVAITAKKRPDLLQN
ncbi:MAG: tRNA (guanosine(37)-N1)-methyltransferase TrmD [Defluviitaleaceae bacterium]|nr:tRNA (guanosine(37)-N1)-methyltransferase TrmD [Defluviitaleaceae bacterium]